MLPSASSAASYRRRIDIRFGIFAAVSLTCAATVATETANAARVSYSLTAKSDIPDAAAQMVANFNSDLQGLSSRTARQLNYDTGPITDPIGTPLPNGKATALVDVDLRSGAFKAKSQSDLVLMRSLTTGGQIAAGTIDSTAALAYSDRLTFSIANAQPTTVTFAHLVFNVEGTLGLQTRDTPSDVRTQFSAALNVVSRRVDSTVWAQGGGSVFSSCGNAIQSCQDSMTNSFPVAQGFSATVSNSTLSTGKSFIDVLIPLRGASPLLDLQIDLTTLTRSGGLSDFSNTGVFNVDVPDGTTWTSESQLLLAVAEPSSIVLIGMGGLMLLGGRRLARRTDQHPSAA